jgi:hypothetical protein
MGLQAGRKKGAAMNKHKKAKFRVGQVVCVRDKWMHAGTYFRIEEVLPGKDSPLYLSGTNYANEVALRPLTAKESGR